MLVLEVCFNDVSGESLRSRGSGTSLMRKGGELPIRSPPMSHKSMVEAKRELSWPPPAAGMAMNHIQGFEHDVPHAPCSFVLGKLKGVRS